MLTVYNERVTSQDDCIGQFHVVAQALRIEAAERVTLCVQSGQSLARFRPASLIGSEAPLLVYQIFSNQKLVLHNKGMCEAEVEAQ